MKKTVHIIIILLLLSLLCSCEYEDDPPVDFYGPMICEKNITLSDAIDGFLEELDKAECGDSVILKKLFGGDVELAKNIMDNELCHELFPDSDTTTITIERFWDETENRPCDDDERLELVCDGIRASIRIESAISVDGYTKIVTDSGEYYKKDASDQYTYAHGFIDLGKGVILYINVTENQPDREAAFEKLVDYGLSIKNSVVDWEATPLL